MCDGFVTGTYRNNTGASVETKRLGLARRKMRRVESQPGSEPKPGVMKVVNYCGSNKPTSLQRHTYLGRRSLAPRRRTVGLTMGLCRRSDEMAYLDGIP